MPTKWFVTLFWYKTKAYFSWKNMIEIFESILILHYAYE